MQGKKFVSSKEDLNRLYWDEGKSLTQIAKIFNVKYGTIAGEMKRLGIPIRSRAEGLGYVDINKETLENLYHKQKLILKEVAKRLNVSPSTVRTNMKKLGIPCRTKTDVFRLDYQKGRRRPTRKRKHSPFWKGGRVKDGEYIGIKIYPDDFFYPMADSRGYVKEHRLVVAKNLKRCLLVWEVVHHKNGVKDDNRLENLELLPTYRQHLPSMELQSLVKKLERRVEKQQKEIKLLRWQIKELQSHLVREP